MIHFRKINEKIKKYENMKTYLNMVKHDQEMTKITKKAWPHRFSVPTPLKLMADLRIIK